MRGIKAGLDARKAAAPNLVELSAREVWRSRHPESVADPSPARAWTALRAPTRRADEKTRAATHRHSSRFEHVCLRTAVQCLSGKPGLAGRKHCLLRFHQRGDVPRRIEPWLDRSLLPSKITIAHVHNLIFNKHSHKPLQVIFFPMYRRAALAARKHKGAQRLPDSVGDAGDRGSSFHKGNGPLWRT